MTARVSSASDPNKAAQPPSLQKIVARAVEQLKPQRIWLFGSRARGDHRRHSDIDLAFDLSNGSQPRWARFVADMEDSAPTLLDLDLVDLHACAPALRSEIETQGIVLYERSPR